MGPDLPGQVYVYRLVTEAFKRSGYNVEISYYTWTRAVYTAEKGISDGLFPEYFDVNHEENFVYSDSFPGGPVKFYKRKNDFICFVSNPQKDLHVILENLKFYRFGVVRGYVNIKEFDDADYLIKDEAVDDETNLKKLHNDRVDLVFIDRYVAEYIILRKFPEHKKSLEFMEPALENKKLYIASSKKQVEILHGISELME